MSIAAVLNRIVLFCSLVSLHTLAGEPSAVESFEVQGNVDMGDKLTNRIFQALQTQHVDLDMTTCAKLRFRAKTTTEMQPSTLLDQSLKDLQSPARWYQSLVDVVGFKSALAGVVVVVVFVTFIVFRFCSCGSSDCQQRMLSTPQSRFARFSVDLLGSSESDAQLFDDTFQAAFPLIPRNCSSYIFLTCVLVFIFVVTFWMPLLCHSEASRDQVKDYTTEFKSIDTRRKGYVTRSDIRGQMSVTDSELDDFFDRADTNQDGRARLSEYITYAAAFSERVHKVIQPYQVFLCDDRNDMAPTLSYYISDGEGAAAYGFAAFVPITVAFLWNLELRMALRLFRARVSDLEQQITEEGRALAEVRGRLRGCARCIRAQYYFMLLFAFGFYGILCVPASQAPDIERQHQSTVFQVVCFPLLVYCGLMLTLDWRMVPAILYFLGIVAQIVVGSLLFGDKLNEVASWPHPYNFTFWIAEAIGMTCFLYTPLAYFFVVPSNARVTFLRDLVVPQLFTQLEKADAEKSKLIKQLQSQLDAYDRERAR